MLRNRQATSCLTAAVRRIPADLDALRGAVADGAAVTTVIDAPSQTIFVADKNFFRYNGTSALSLLIRRGELEAVLACLKSPKAINFKSSANILSPIEEIAMANTAGWPEYNRRVLSAVVDRIARHPSDMVDWPMKEYRTDLLSLAAKHQLLSVFWPVLKRDVTYFADQTEPIPLTPMVWAADWAALGPEEQQCFNKDEAVYMDADAATSRLCVACFRYPEPDYAAVDECVSAGADVMFDLVFSQPLLNSVLWDGSVKLVEALLRTPRRIDFSKESHLLGTPLHFITQPWLGVQKKTPQEIRQLLYLVLDRLEQHPDDAVDWGKSTRVVGEPITMAAFTGHLAPFVEVVFHERPVSYFTDHPGKIKIMGRAFRSDVDRLRPADRERFYFAMGIDE
eukprot:gene1877-biopygen1545